MPLIDVFMTTKDRGDLLRQTLDSFFENTQRDLYRFTLVRDGNYSSTDFASKDYSAVIDYVVTSHDNEGLGPSINRALAHIDTTNRYFDDSSFMLGPETRSEFVCYVQDDLLFTKNWLNTLAQRFLLFEKRYNLGFASGLECVEHKTQLDLGGGNLLKPWIRAACMFGRRSYWQSMFPIPRRDPETGRERAKPNDGIGSGVDWHFIRNHENSVCKTGRTCLVIPGLVKHLGFSCSTWLNRNLPESESDLAVVKPKIHEMVQEKLLPVRKELEQKASEIASLVPDYFETDVEGKMKRLLDDILSTRVDEFISGFRGSSRK